MIDGEKKKMSDPVGRMTARDALVYAAGEDHGHCTVVSKRVKRDEIVFSCACGNTYFIAAKTAFIAALRNVPAPQSVES